MLAEDRGSGGNMCLPMVLNVVFPMLMCWTSLLNQLSMHILVDLKQDYFAFRYELANGLLGGFRSCQLPGRPRSYEHTTHWID